MSKELKYFQNEPYLTPNNYDIYFNENEIPSNKKKKKGYILEKRLQKLMPLTKFIHLGFDVDTTKMANNQLVINSRLKINKQEVKFI